MTDLFVYPGPLHFPCIKQLGVGRGSWNKAAWIGIAVIGSYSNCSSQQDPRLPWDDTHPLWGDALHYVHVSHCTVGLSTAIQNYTVGGCGYVLQPAYPCKGLEEGRGGEKRGEEGRREEKRGEDSESSPFARIKCILTTRAKLSNFVRFPALLKDKQGN